MKKNQYIFQFLMVIAVIAVMTGCNKKDSDTEYLATPTPAEPFKDIFEAKAHMGINYGPFHYNGQAPGTQIPVSQIQADLTTIAKNFQFIRTYTVADGLDQVIPQAAARGIEVAAGIHCYPNDASKTKADIDLAVNRASANPYTVTALVVGNETNLLGVNYVPDATVAGYMDYARQKLSAAGLDHISVSSCITGVGGLPNGMGDNKPCPKIMEKCVSLNKHEDRVIFMTIYPYYGQKANNQNNPGNIAGNMEWSYNNGMAQAVAMGIDVVIGEIGWPSGGNDPNMENVPNMKTNFTATLNWINGKNIYNKAFNTLWFSIFDEPWKTAEPFGIGPHWGLYGPNGATTPKFTIPPLL